MPFSPENITKQHILEAVNRIERESLKLEPSTKFDVILNGNPYPPKEIMRYAHEAANGEPIWNYSGGEPTNKYLTALGFKVISKVDSEQHSYSSNSLIKLLKATGEEAAKAFFKSASELMKKLSVKEKDSRLTFGTINNKQFSITIGQRYCLVLNPFEEYPYCFITENKYPDSETARFTSFDGKSTAYYCRSKDINSYTKYFSEIANASQTELSRTHKSGFRQSSKASFERAVLDENFRDQLFEQAFSDHNYWALHCNPKAWDAVSEISQYNEGTWLVNKRHESAIKPGDEYILWLSGPNAGIYLFGTITDSPRMLPENQERIKKFSNNNAQFSKEDIRVKLSYDQKLTDSPITRSQILEADFLAKGTSEYSFFYNPQGVTSRELTKDIFLRLKRMINGSHESEMEFNNQKETSESVSKNVILYGPPGTGKTYNSIDKAVEIALPNKYVDGDHQSNKKLFDGLRNEGQIEFVTFHQNYSYEDFMVGIRPNISEDSETLTFQKHYGIFYKLIQRARENYIASQVEEGKLISVQELVNNLIERLQDGNVLELKTYSNTPYSIEYLSESTFQLVYSNGSRKNTLSVSTLMDITEGKREYTTALKTYYYPLKDYILNNRVDTRIEKEQIKNYVLIIDEINRANISRVFGELITLLEDDKRIGEKNELKISLPNGEIDFGVPPNMYLIGTMNTADKSIALVDIALRRRFEFVGYFPNYDLLENSNKNLLKHINREIYDRKKSADFLIGHAYFMNETDTTKTLKNKVIPLLMEYFAGKSNLVEEIFQNSEWRVQYDIEKFDWQVQTSN